MRVPTGSRNSEYPWIFTVLGRDSKWLLVSRQFQKMKQQIPKRDKIWLVGVYWSEEKICHKIIKKMIPKTLSIEMINKPKQNDVFYLQKSSFLILSN